MNVILNFKQFVPCLKRIILMVCIPFMLSVLQLILYSCHIPRLVQHEMSHIFIIFFPQRLPIVQALTNTYAKKKETRQKSIQQENYIFVIILISFQNRGFHEKSKLLHRMKSSFCIVNQYILVEYQYFMYLLLT